MTKRMLKWLAPILFVAACSGTESGTRYQAGVARELVNPDHPVALGGYGLCIGSPEICRYSTGVHDDLAASAVALRDAETGEAVVFVGVDTAGLIRWDIDLIHQAATKAFREQLGIDFDGTRVVVGSSHSHQAPDTSGMYGPMEGAGRDEDYAAYLRDQVVKAAIRAYQDLRDVNLDWARGTKENTTKDPFSVDHDLYVLRGRTPAGETVFTLSRWSSHPTTYPETGHVVSSDFIGVYRHEIERRLGGLAVFFNGAAGSTYPITPVPCTMPDTFPEGQKNPVDGPDEMFNVPLQLYSDCACIGSELADAAEAAMQAAVPVAETGIVARFQRFRYHPTKELLQSFAEMAPMHWDNAPVEDPESRITSQFSWVTVGDLDFLTVPGEAFPSLSDSFKAALGRANTIVLGLSQDWTGYLLTKKLWDEQTQYVQVQYHISLSLSPDIESTYIDALQALKAAGTK